jgi:predicted nucleic acid-binding protein
VSNELVLDTDAFSNLFQKRGNHADYARHLQGRIPVLSFATVAEVRFGAAKAKWGPPRIAALEQALRRYVIAPYDDKMPELWGTLRAQAQENGHALGADSQINDLWIAATAIYYNAPLLTGNTRHFANFPGLDLAVP